MSYQIETGLHGLESKCCGAEVKVAGNTTHYYYCTKCQAPCDIKKKD